MLAVARPFATATAALLGAGAIAAVPVAATAPVSLPALRAPEIALQASIFDILGFPVYQQAISNEIEFVAIRAAGLAEGGAGLAQSLADLPSTVITAIGQTFSGNPLDALTTVEDWVIGTGSATLVPPVLANIEVGQIQLAIQAALLLAQPTALVQFGSGLYTAIDTIARSFIIAGQNLVDAVLSLNIGGIVEAVVGGVAGVIDGFVSGGQAVIDGIAAAQTTLVAALQARPITPLAGARQVPVALAAERVAPAATGVPAAAATQTADETATAPAGPDTTPAEITVTETRATGQADSDGPSARSHGAGRGAKARHAAGDRTDAPSKATAGRAAAN